MMYQPKFCQKLLYHSVEDNSLSALVEFDLVQTKENIRDENVFIVL